MIHSVSIPEGSNGPWTIERFVVPKNVFGNFRLAMTGRGAAPGTYTKLVHKTRGIVMSDTTAERRDHSWFVHMAKGRVLINGLGLGMCLAAVLAKPEVTRATVVEIDQDLIDLVWPHYSCDRAEIAHASAFDYAPPRGVRFGAVWHDIWDDICEDNRPEMQRLHRKYGRRADWQGSWGRSLMDYERRRYAR